MKLGETIEIEIRHITEDSKGVGWHSGKVILVEGVDEDDGIIRVEVVRILEETIIAKRISRIRKETSQPIRRGTVQNPYQEDDEYSMDEAVDDDYEDSGED